MGYSSKKYEFRRKRTFSRTSAISWSQNNCWSRPKETAIQAVYVFWSQGNITKTENDKSVVYGVLFRIPENEKNDSDDGRNIDLPIEEVDGKKMAVVAEPETIDEKKSNEENPSEEKGSESDQGKADESTAINKKE